MPTLVEKAFRRFEARQHLFFKRLPKRAKKKLAEASNRYAQLIVTGDEGGTFYFRYLGGRFQMLNDPPDVPEENLDKMTLDGDETNYKSGDEVFSDVLARALSPRAAVSRRYFQVNSDRVIYDTEELAQAFEGFLEDMRVVFKDS